MEHYLVYFLFDQNFLNKKMVYFAEFHDLKNHLEDHH